MKTMKTSVSLLTMLAAGVPAFGASWTGANGTEFVTVGDAGNAADTTGYGKVDYNYSIGKYEVTNSQYAKFLNSVGSNSVAVGTQIVSLYSGLGVADYGGIVKGDDGTFSAREGCGNKAVNYVSVYAAAMYCNWLGNGATQGAAYLTGAYDFTGGASMEVLSGVSDGALYRLPTENEWYKAAYYKGSGMNSDYWTYATQSDSITTSDANYGNASTGNVAEVGSYGNASAYGTCDQTGNVWEWTLRENESEETIARGGSFLNDVSSLSSSFGDNALALNAEYADAGFRVSGFVTIPEPSAFGLLAGLGALAIVASRRSRRSKKTA